jgi:outer membrane protein assembly factor BamB
MHTSCFGPLLPRVVFLVCACILLLAGPQNASPPTGNKAGEVVMLGAEGEAAHYWPGWRGPTRQGLAAPGAYPDTWSDKDNVLWKVALPGQGNSSPVVWKDRIFLTTSRDRGQQRSILCLSRTDGKLLWETPVPAGILEKTQPKNGFASGTVAVDGERVYAYFGNFGLLCVDFAGKQLWHKSFGPMDALHGTACSPLLYKDRVIVFQDHAGKMGGFVAAFDRRTGAQLWKTPRKETVGWGSPVAIRAGDQDQIIVSSQLKVYAYNPEDGKVLWTCAGNLFEVTPTPVAGRGVVFCSSGRAGPTLAIRPDGRGDVTTTQVKWKSLKGSPFIPSPLLYENQLYIINDIISVVTCFDADSGKILWRERLGTEVKHGFSASPVAVNGKVFFTNDQGETFVVTAGTRFQLLHINRLGEKTLASPALVDGRWYFRTEDHLLCIGKQ